MAGGVTGPCGGRVVGFPGFGCRTCSRRSATTVARDGVVGFEKAAREVQSNGVPGPQIEHDRTRVPSKCRTIVEQDVRFRFRHLTRSEPLLVEHVAENVLHQLRVGGPAVPGGVSDYGHLLRWREAVTWTAGSAARAPVRAIRPHAGARSPGHRRLRCAGSPRSGTRAVQSGPLLRGNRSTRRPALIRVPS